MNKNILHIIIPGQPIPKARSRRGPAGNWYNSQSQIMNQIKKIIIEQLPEDFIPINISIPIKVDISFFFKPSKTELKNKKLVDLIKNDDYPYIKKKDRDNLDKFTLDCMTGYVFDDDCQVYAGSIYKYYSIVPRTEIMVSYET